MCAQLVAAAPAAPTAQTSETPAASAAVNSLLLCMPHFSQKASDIAPLSGVSLTRTA
jgi:hypothetical protein